MSNYAWVCFDCRMSVRRHGSAKSVRCPHCAQPCECLGYKVPIPPKAKAKAWEALCERFYRFRRDCLLRAQKGRIRSIHDLEQEIVRLQAMPTNQGRIDTIEYLKKRLSAIRLARA